MDEALIRLLAPCALGSGSSQWASSFQSVAAKHGMRTDPDMHAHFSLSQPSMRGACPFWSRWSLLHGGELLVSPTHSLRGRSKLYPAVEEVSFLEGCPQNVGQKSICWGSFGYILPFFPSKRLDSVGLLDPFM